MTLYRPSVGIRGADELLATLDNPHHRAIITNYRRHALLEVAGRWPEILTPEMTIDHPVYRLGSGGVMRTLDGRDAVADFYRKLAESGSSVFGPVEQKLLVADWGFAAEATFQRHALGRTLTGLDVDPDLTYRVEWPVASFWHYTDDARLIGEHVYAGLPESVTEAHPGDGISAEEARAEAEMLLDLSVAVAV